MKTLDLLDAKLERRTPITSVPFTINAAWSYYLTSNFTQSGSASGIIISADDVTGDLGGFVLLGTLAGTAPGISIPAAQKNVQVRNGTIGIIKNSAKANTTNYNIVADNRYGPIVDLTAAVTGNSAADTTTTTHPWTNFSY